MTSVLFTAELKAEAVDRELAYRRRVYARRVEGGKMRPEAAAFQIAIFESISDDYHRQAEGERLL